jgi:hypothetical protein
MAFKLSAANKSFMLSVIMLNVIMLSAAYKSFMLNVIMLSDLAPNWTYLIYQFVLSVKEYSLKITTSYR